MNWGVFACVMTLMAVTTGVIWLRFELRVRRRERTRPIERLEAHWDIQGAGGGTLEERLEFLLSLGPNTVLRLSGLARVREENQRRAQAVVAAERAAAIPAPNWVERAVARHRERMRREYPTETPNRPGELLVGPERPILPGAVIGGYPRALSEAEARAHNEAQEADQAVRDVASYLETHPDILAPRPNYVTRERDARDRFLASLRDPNPSFRNDEIARIRNIRERLDAIVPGDNDALRRLSAEVQNTPVLIRQDVRIGAGQANRDPAAIAERAELCVRIARSEFERGEPANLVEERALELMGLPNDELQRLVAGLSQEVRLQAERDILRHRTSSLHPDLDELLRYDPKAPEPNVSSRYERELDV